MVDRRKTVLLLAPVLVILAIALTFPTSAFTTTSLDRTVTVSVASDDQALVALIDGHPGGGIVEQTQNGELTIDFRNGGAAGANEEAQFTIGDPNAHQTNHAFKIVNQGTQPITFEFQYAVSNGFSDSDSGVNLEFIFYFNANGPYRVSEESTQTTIQSVGVGDSIYVVLTLDTRGLSNSDDLSGTLEITASDGGS